MRARASLCLTATTIATVAGCGSKGGSWQLSPATTAPATSAPTAPATTAPATTRDPTALELAQMHAPLYRFGAYVPGDSSPANKDEDFFPQSIVHFFDELQSGKARVVTKEGGATPGENTVLPFSGAASIASDSIYGYPRLMSGDEPGTAPVYFHAYEDVTKRVRNPDGSGEDLDYIEYWYFIPQDQSKIGYVVPPIFQTTPPIPQLVFYLGGHRSDWQPDSLAVAIIRGPGGSFLRTEIRKAIYNHHHDQSSVDPGQFETVDDQGNPDPRAKHPVIYVSVGKHESWPEPGVWHDEFGLRFLGVVFDEFFYGNGFAWSSWKSPVLDLLGPVTPDFAPPSFLALVGSGLTLTDWRDYMGLWGPDRPLGPLAGSDEGPKATRYWGARDTLAKPWLDTKRTAVGLTLGPIPQVVPAPTPKRN